MSDVSEERGTALTRWPETADEWRQMSRELAGFARTFRESGFPSLRQVEAEIRAGLWECASLADERARTTE